MDHVKKRETSVSTADLHNSVKRLAISASTAQEPLPGSNAHIVNTSGANKLNTVLSVANDINFESKYELMQEIGRGGFSVVYKCRERATGIVYACKIVDLRPMKLRSKFNPSRLRREVDIMKRLKHDNIIKFIEVFETANELYLIMEFCPGKELFDVILSKSCFSEDEARPVFAQMASALFYLHSLNIIHRDIKPENVLMIDGDGRTPPVVKLLDFGLSKNAGDGRSAAKTFVGTPCYLAPEVEFTSKGSGGTYGVAADCWSLGAVLYVMLVARFPEFVMYKKKQTNTKEFNPENFPKLRLPSQLWETKSNDAMDLVSRLMDNNPETRLKSYEVLQHPWLQSYRVSPERIESQLTMGRLQSHEFQWNDTDDVDDNAWYSVDGHVNSTNRVHGDGVDLNRYREQQSDYTVSNNAQTVTNIPPPPPSMNWDTGVGQYAAGSHEGVLAISSKHPRNMHHISDRGIGNAPAITMDPVFMNSYSTNPNANLNTNPYANSTYVNTQMNVVPGYVSVHNDDRSQMQTESRGPMALAINVNSTNANTNARNHNMSGLDENQPLTPLLEMQMDIANCFDEAHYCFKDYPELAAEIRLGAAMCRRQVLENSKMLHKVERTAAMVLEFFPELEMAIEDGAPKIATSFFNTVKTWINDLHILVTNAQQFNHENMMHLQRIVEKSTSGYRDEHEKLRIQNNNRKQLMEHERKQQLQLKEDQEKYHAISNRRQLGNGSDNADDYVAIPKSLLSSMQAQIQPALDQLNKHQQQTQELKGDVNDVPSAVAITKLFSMLFGLDKGNLQQMQQANQMVDPSTPPSPSYLAEPVLKPVPELEQYIQRQKSRVSTVNGNEIKKGKRSGSTGSTGSIESMVDVEDDEDEGEYSYMNADSVSYSSSNGQSHSVNADEDILEYHGSISQADKADSGDSGNGDDVFIRKPSLRNSVHMDEATEEDSGAMSRNIMHDNVNAIVCSNGNAGTAENTSTSITTTPPPGSPSTSAAFQKLGSALDKLRRVDIILQNLGAFWGYTEVKLDELAKKGQLAEQYMVYGDNLVDKPRLFARFSERIAEYKSFWKTVQTMCNGYSQTEGMNSNSNVHCGMNTNGTAGGSTTNPVSFVSSNSTDTNTSNSTTKSIPTTGTNGRNGPATCAVGTNNFSQNSRNISMYSNASTNTGVSSISGTSGYSSQNPAYSTNFNNFASPSNQQMNPNTNPSTGMHNNLGASSGSYFNESAGSPHRPIPTWQQHQQYQANRTTPGGVGGQYMNNMGASPATHGHQVGSNHMHSNGIGGVGAYPSPPIPVDRATKSNIPLNINNNMYNPGTSTTPQSNYYSNTTPSNDINNPINMSFEAFAGDTFATHYSPSTHNSGSKYGKINKIDSTDSK